jgi:acyl carrier protein
MTTRRILEAYPEAALYAFSSVNGVMGGFAAGAYSAANAFLDALAHEEALRGRACYSLAWSTWDGVGMSAAFAGRDGASRLGYLPLTVKQGLQSLAMIADAAPGHVLIGLDGRNPLVRRQIAGVSTVECLGLRGRGAGGLPTGKFAALFDSFGNHVPVQLYDRIDQVATAPHQQCLSASQDGELASDTGRIISEVWTEVLQRNSIDPDENFFDLGGNSVLLASASFKLSERLKRQIAITDLFRFPTLRQLALYYNQNNGESSAPLSNSQERGLERRARRQQRRSRA